MSTTNPFEIKDGKLTLRQDDENLSPLLELFEQIVQAESIEVTEVYTLSSNGLTAIQGKADIWQGPTTVFLAFETNTFELQQFRLSKRLRELPDLNLNGTAAFNQLRDELELEISGDGAAFQPSIAGIIQIRDSNSNLPVRIIRQNEKYVIESEFDPAAPPRLFELGYLFGGTDTLSGFFDWLPESIRELVDIQVDSFSFTIDPEDDKKLTNIAGQLTFLPAKTWPLIPGFDFLRAGDLWAQLEVTHPLDEEARAATVQVGGALLIGTAAPRAKIELAGHWPDLKIQGVMAEGHTISVLELFEVVGLPAAGLPTGDEALQIDALELVVEPSQADPSYSFAGSISNIWGLQLAGDATFEIKELSLAISYQESHSPKMAGSFSGKLEVAGIDVSLLAMTNSEDAGFTFFGTAGMDNPISIGALISDLAGKFETIELPEVLDNLQLSNIEVSFNTYTKDFHFSCLTSIDIEDTTAGLLLNIDIIRTTAGYHKLFSGLLTIGPRQFEVSFESTAGSSVLQAAFTNEEGEEIDLVGDLLGLISDDENLSLIDGDTDELNLTVLEVYDLRLRYEKKKPSGTKVYRFSGTFAWNPTIPLGLDEPLELSVGATIENLQLVQKPGVSGKQVSGTIGGTVDTDIPYFESLSLTTRYEFGTAADRLFLQVGIGSVAFETQYQKTDGDVHLEFSVKLAKDLSLGDVITFVVSLVDPTVDEFEFDPPWNFLNEFTLPKELVNHISLTMTFLKNGTKSMGVKIGVPEALVPDFLDGILKINHLELQYESKDITTGAPAGQKKKKKDKKVKIILDATFLGKKAPLGWDPINEAPPEIPGQGAAIFDLRYLGLGQHVAFTRTAEVQSIKEVMGLLRGVIDEGSLAIAGDRSLKNRNPLELFGNGGPIAFSAESDWLIGLDISLLKTLNLSIIFNDPLIYGLRIELYGAYAQNFAGLQFEILYRRINDQVGVYHIDLTLPDFVRYLQFGAVSVTLPILVLDIYTNGDFKVDLGFPWNLNFSRSFAVEVLPFTGAGGIYFNKLSAATATSTPDVAPEIGVFTPVYEFGLGLRIGLGKTFNKGPLKAEISITVQGIVEGVISWYNPRQAGERELYYAVRGAIAIVGRLYGAVDFKVIKVEVEVVARAMIQFVVEIYKPILINLIAEVSVRASVKILFIKVTFSFSLRLELGFTIETGDEGLEPWKDGSRGIQTASRAAMLATSRSLTGMARPGFDWSKKEFSLPQNIADNIDEQDGKYPLDMFFQPALTWTPEGVHGEALLFIENAVDSADPTAKDFNILLQGLLQWTWVASGRQEDEMVTFQSADQLYNGFVAPDSTLFSYEELEAFLAEYFKFRLKECTAEMQGTLFPMLPQLEMRLGSQTTPISFDQDAYQLNDAQLQELANFFNRLKAQFTPSPGLGQTGQPEEEKTSTTEFIFVDYARLLIRSGLGTIRDHLESQKEQAFLITDLLAELDFNDIATSASRFLLYGLHFPAINNGMASLEAQPLYEATAQQFALSGAKVAAAKEYRITLIPPETSPVKLELPETSPAELIYRLPDTSDENDPKFPLAKLAREMANIEKADIDFAFFTDFQHKPSLIPYYRRENLHFALRLWVPGEDFVILPFPSSLHIYLLEKAQNPFISLFLQDNSSDSPEVSESNVIPADNLNWGTRIDITIRPVPRTAGPGFLPETYLMAGTSESDQDLLEQVWKHLEDANIPSAEKAIELSLLYQPDENAVDTRVTSFSVDDQEEGILIIKSNLATERITDNPVVDVISAPLSDEQAFLKLIWEGSNLNTGGYYLHIPHGDNELNETLFKATGEKALILLIRFTHPADRIFDFHNCAYIEEALNLEEQFVIARSSEQIPVLSIPPGHLGFQLERNTIQSEGLSWEDELKNLYQLLGYKILGDENFAGTQQGMPIGPTGEDRWLYERIIPTYRLVKNPGSDSGLLPPNRNPYLGISSSAALQIECWWQDLYGNQLLQARESASFDVRYTDPIIGINQWPSVAESYEFVKKAEGKASLDIEFAFEPAPFVNALVAYQKAAIPSEAQRTQLEEKLTSALAIFEKAYYQLSQPDVTISIENSVVPGWKVSGEDDSDFNKEEIRTFIRNVYGYLRNLYREFDKDSSLLPAPPPNYEQSFEVVFKEGQTLKLSKSFIFPVTVNIDIQRSLDYVHEDLKDQGAIKSEYESVLRDRSYLSPRVTALQSEEVTVTQALLDKSAAALIRTNLRTPGIIRENVQITWENQTVTTEVKDTFEILRKRIQDRLQREGGDPLATFTIEDLAALWKDNSHLLVEGARLKLPPDPSSLRGFASKFQTAFPGLRLAVSEEHRKNASKADRNDLPKQPVWVVHLGGQGINYDIAEQVPAFFAIPPPANTLLGGKVEVDQYQQWKNEKLEEANALIFDVQGGLNKEEKQFDALDLNVLARDFLVALEDFLQPENLIPAYKLFPDEVTQILRQKAGLAASISAMIEPILEKDSDETDRKKQAGEALYRQLLVNLVEGYDIETIVQYEVNVQTGNHLVSDWKTGFEPRISGKASVVHARLSGADIDAQELDFSLSPGKMALVADGEKSYFTYLFDTKTPERFSEIELELLFESAEIEHQIEIIQGIADYEASSWLSFILPEDLKQYKLTTGDGNRDSTLQRLHSERAVPKAITDKLKGLEGKAFDTRAAFREAVSALLEEEELEQFEKEILLYAQLHPDNPNYMGSKAVPIPLRSYPMPPGLVIQRAEADPDSLDELGAVRQWRYTIVYEHPDIAQDTIDCVVELNAPPPPSPIAVRGLSANHRNLFEALVNFAELYPALSADLALIRNEEGDVDKAKIALVAFRTLVSEISHAWSFWSPKITIPEPVKGDLHYEIREEKSAGVKRVFITTKHDPITGGPEPAPEPALALPGYKYGYEIDPSQLPATIPPAVREKLKAMAIKTFDSRSALRRTLKAILSDSELNRYWEQLLENARNVKWTTDPDNSTVREFFFKESEGDLTFFGDSSIPDRMFSIENLDVIYHQNAWAFIWLSRNKELIPEFDTNPVFVFHTPAVRFNNLVTPFLVNDERWDIARLGSAGGQPADRDLASHLKALFDVLLPQKEMPADGEERPDFEIRLNCRYAFAFANGKNLSYDLLSSFPVLVSLRIANPYIADGQDSNSFLEYIEQLSGKIMEWHRTNKPVKEQAAFLFSISYFSKIEPESLSSLPMLQIEHLALQLENVLDLE